MRSSTPFATLALAATLIAPAPARAADRPDLPALEQAWHGCVRAAYDRQPERGSRVGRDKAALAECKAHEDAYVTALMAARPEGSDDLIVGWAKTWAAYAAYVVDPVAAWIDKLRR